MVTEDAEYGRGTGRETWLVGEAKYLFVVYAPPTDPGMILYCEVNNGITGPPLLTVLSVLAGGAAPPMPIQLPQFSPAPFGVVAF